MVRVSAKIEGGEELVRKLKKMGGDVDIILEAAVQAGAQIVANASNGYAPEPLIETETTARRKLHVEVDVGPPDDKWPWKYLETGAQPHEIQGPLSIEFEGQVIVVGGASHPGMAASPFLRPAFDTQKNRAVSAVGNKIKGVLK